MGQPEPRGDSRRRLLPAASLLAALMAGVRDLALWKTPRSALVLILSTETLAVTWLFIANMNERPGLADFGRFALLLFVALVYTEGANRIELLRRFVAQVTFANVTNLWTMTAALVLPIGLAGTLATVLGGYNVVRLVRSRSGTPFRATYVATSDVLATLSVASLLAFTHAGHADFANGPVAALAVLLAIATYYVVQQALVAGAIYLATRPTRLADTILNRNEQIMELSTFTMAVLFAIALVHAPYLSPLVLILVVVLRRSSLVQELQVQATRDAKTGLLNAGAWRQEAERLLIRSERLSGTMSVVMLDLDHFKVLNDTYGHQAGDETLRLIAQTLSDALRGYDAIGRFGGEEFIALLNEADAHVSEAVAERLCTRIRELRLPHGSGVTASIGVGVGAAGVNGLDELIAVADRALYVAKRAGRDQVRVEAAPTRPNQPAGQQHAASRRRDDAS